MLEDFIISNGTPPLPGHAPPSAWRTRLFARFWSTIGADGQDALRKLVTMVGISLFTQLAALTSLYLVVVSLTVAEFGILSSALAVQGFGTILSTLGVRPILVRELSKEPGRRNELCTAYIVISLIGGTVVAGIVFAVLAFLELHTRESLVFEIVACGIVLAAVNPVPILDADGKQVASTALASLGEVVALAIVATLWNNDQLSLIPITLIFAGKWFAMSALNWSYLFYQRQAFRWHLVLTDLVPLLRASTPLSAAAMLQITMISSGPILARTLGGQTAAGIYGLAQQAVTAHTLVMGLASRIVAPRLAVRYADRGFMIRAGFAYVGVACCLSFAGIVSGLFVLHKFLDPAYHAASWPLVITLVALVIRSLGRYSNLAHVAMHQERAVLVSAVIGATLLLPLIMNFRPIQGLLTLPAASSLAIVLTSTWLCVTIVSLLAHWKLSVRHETWISKQ